MLLQLFYSAKFGIVFMMLTTSSLSDDREGDPFSQFCSIKRSWKIEIFCGDKYRGVVEKTNRDTLEELRTAIIFDSEISVKNVNILSVSNYVDTTLPLNFLKGTVVTQINIYLPYNMSRIEKNFISATRVEYFQINYGKELAFIHPEAFSNLNELKGIIIMNCKKLKELDLNLYNCPEFCIWTIFNTAITTLDMPKFQSEAALFENLRVTFTSNPLICDCRTVWMKKLQDSPVSIECEHLPNAKQKNIKPTKNHTLEDFCPTGVSTTKSSTTPKSTEASTTKTTTQTTSTTKEKTEATYKTTTKTTTQTTSTTKEKTEATYKTTTKTTTQTTSTTKEKTEATYKTTTETTVTDRTCEPEVSTKAPEDLGCILMIDTLICDGNRMDLGTCKLTKISEALPAVSSITLKILFYKDVQLPYAFLKGKSIKTLLVMNSYVKILGKNNIHGSIVNFQMETMKHLEFIHASAFQEIQNLETIAFINCVTLTVANLDLSKNPSIRSINFIMTKISRMSMPELHPNVNPSRVDFSLLASSLICDCEAVWTKKTSWGKSSVDCLQPRISNEQLKLSDFNCARTHVYFPVQSASSTSISNVGSLFLILLCLIYINELLYIL